MTPHPSTQNATPDLRLDAADARAVDLLLDPSSLSSASADAASRSRHVGKVLGLLDLMPEPRPSGDLVARTVRRVQEAPTARGDVAAAALRPAASATGNVGRQIANSPESPEGV